MKTITQLLSLVICLLFVISCEKKKEEPTNTENPKDPGYVSFTLGSTTLPNNGSTTITLFGCETNLIHTDTTTWQGPQEFSWNKSNQVLSGVPFGSRYDSTTKKPYYISKYYVASPPILKLDETGKVNKNTLYDIGLVIPDKFEFRGEAPVQRIYLDYTVLKPMHVTYFNIDFGNIERYIPFRVECSNLPWIETAQIQNGKGGSGIGSLKKGTPQDQLFLPYYYEEESTSYEAAEKKKIFLDTKVTILNDILLNEKILFLNGKDTLETINLTDLYDSKVKGQTIQLISVKRDSTDIPAGGVSPIVQIESLEK